MNKKIIFGAIALSISCFFDAAAADLAGRWKTIDDKTGYARAEVQINKLKDGSYAGKIVKVHAIPNRPAISRCEKCNGKLKDAPLIGLQIFSGFHQSDNNQHEYIDGKVIDPLTGNVYQGKGQLNSRGNVLTLRGYLGTTLLGRTVSWIRVN
ncbi:DUF2147 domain-containing protein [Acinetobacter tianfuensis]|uniref:DUF2147 domain-containing protein n=1 Tax=Acinetobacter tianfuensis TaxID=2419603 RepID=A0A3A8E8E7_9GAMM|nr:DUF2147 domain-containing protein [Acinetobacter tianfuensis]RKG31292.1 DUF2147 domain-containing protein [Acinetobacter tianfuensis]